MVQAFSSIQYKIINKCFINTSLQVKTCLNVFNECIKHMHLYWNLYITFILGYWIVDLPKRFQLAVSYWIDSTLFWRGTYGNHAIARVCLIWSVTILTPRIPQMDRQEWTEYTYIVVNYIITCWYSRVCCHFTSIKGKLILSKFYDIIRDKCETESSNSSYQNQNWASLFIRKKK